MKVIAIYRLLPSGSREELQPDRSGHFTLVDARIPYDAANCRSNLRNRASMAVRAHSLEEAALLIELGYAARAKTGSGGNYLYPKDLLIERR